jgi:flagellum-specific peptidoglycan hydrolase FlgJ
MTDSFVDHGTFIRDNSGYQSALEAYAKTGDADEFARGLQKAHYATDPHYAEVLINIMKGRKLYQYNQKGVAAASAAAAGASAAVVKK